MVFKNRKKQYEVQEFVEEYKIHNEDVGSAHVQIARLTYLITDLSTHLKEHKKDFHSLLGLKKMSSKRRKLLKFLKRTNYIDYEEIIKKLSLRAL
jgi:small subunit ribosomal protein S15